MSRLVSGWKCAEDDPEMALDWYGNAARVLWQRIESRGKADARRYFSRLLARDRWPEPWVDAIRDAFGGRPAAVVEAAKPDGGAAARTQGGTGEA